jgi:hypothetical protein
MSELEKKPRIILSDPNVLHKIKFMQFRRQIIPLIALVAFMVINIFWNSGIFLYLTIASFGWYLLEKMFFRTKNKIAEPEAGTFVSPVDGKVISVRTSPDAAMITISKSYFDVVELRLPYPDLQSEIAGNWVFETGKGQINVRIKSENVKYFDNRNIHGAVIGVIHGKARISIQIPPELKILVKEKQNIFGGETELFSFTEDAEDIKSILVEEPIADKISQ